MTMTKKRWPKIDPVRFTVGAHRRLIGSRLNELKELTRRFDRMLRKELKGFVAWVDKQALEMPRERRDEFSEWYAEDYWQIKKVFPGILWSSLFVTCYSLLESELRSLCEALWHLKNCPLKPSELADKGITRSQTYLKKVVKIKFPDRTMQWQEIKNYNLLRNKFAHGEDRVWDTKEDRKFKSYVEKKTSISLDEHGRILISRDFIQEVIDNLRAFFNDLFDSLEDLKGNSPDS